MMSGWRREAAAAAWCVVAFAQSAFAGGSTAFGTYGPPYRPIVMPPNGAGSTQLSGDCLSDGRIISVTGNSVYLESAPGTGVFSVVANFRNAETGGATDPAFVRVSPDGTRVAVGIGFGKPVAIVPISALGTPGAPTTLAPGVTRFYNIPHYDGAWADANHLAVTFGDFGSPSAVSVLDVSSPVGSPANPTVINGIDGASGGIAFDGVGRLFTGNGYDLNPGGSTTGTIRAFARSVWDGTGGPGPIPFETSGTLIGEVLSASGMVFDLEGNLAVGGGDFNEGDFGYLGVLRSTAIAAALAGLGPINRSDPAAMRRLTPSADPFAFYGDAYNRATGELYATLTDFNTGNNTWYATVPGPGAAAVIGVAGLAVTARRRRRCA